MMDKWKQIMLQKFGKKASKNWITAALDIQMVSLGIKPSCLFDQWLVSGDDMNELITELMAEDLISRNIVVATVGMDVIVYGCFCEKLSESDFQVLYIDVSSALKYPILVGDGKENQTTRTFAAFRDSMCLTNLSDTEASYRSPVNIEICKELNVPCLFGLMLSYPCVYWYNNSEGEENCLSGQALVHFQVKGHLLNSENSSLVKKSKFTCVIYSFSVPENLVDLLRSDVNLWFVRWSDAGSWKKLFSLVWIDEEVLNPQAVCL
ncbi:UPF0739 protein C1orf74 homolog [Physella acuta]|uniref:UPF0739 protein C1orf74 homolog n=1 Tax=Physella acuta TaxID=109671 RepID=UPI0027DC2F0E|nr:UPF0739 protein C1orf74 homolog [Physella acuta]XP_059161933.1 UPF0739 protein C1orf74 homolog [Physella acuta]XP_059161934.1 UPF0739 protein C1orf74 homolog [Physella acuta]XP_059161935.1 UPF0739 protein C1orf74 homolog [Physella acuta]XP_059161936.1 UPF0739 protein C1orf74 homolog [Physella acuta]